MKLRGRKLFVVALLLLAAGAAALVLRGKSTEKGGVIETIASLGVDGKIAIEKWCGEQLLVVARSYLNPELSFDSIEYQYPATVTLANIKLVGDGITFIDAKSMRVEFTEIPVAGQPLVIQTVELVDPVVRLIRRPEGGLLGFSTFLRNRSASTDQQPAVPPSEVFAIRRLAIVNGTLEYQVPNRPAMVLDQLTLDLVSKPAHETDATQAGWYSLDALIARHPLFRWKMGGGINVDSGVLRFDQSKLNMALVPEQYARLLPDVQAFVREHEITGALEATMDGQVPLRGGNPLQLDLDVRLTNGRVAFGDYVLPVDQLDLASRFSEDVYTIDSLEFRGLGGQASGSGKVQLRSPYAANATIDARDLLIEEALRPASTNPSQLKGKLSVNGSASVDLANIKSTSDGAGYMNVTEGRLVQIPVISQLIHTIKLAGGNSSDADRASADLQLIRDRLRMTNIDIVSGALGARGEGTIKFDSTLDFRLSAGPFRSLGNSLNGLGNALDRITDGLVVYYVSGTIGHPVVSLRPFGLGG